jgi:hypothetical protein
MMDRMKIFRDADTFPCLFNVKDRKLYKPSLPQAEGKEPTKETLLSVTWNVITNTYTTA